MIDWSSDLNEALASNDPGFMKAMLGRVPPEVLQRALPYLHRLAKDSEKQGRLDEAVTYYDHLIEAIPREDSLLAERDRVLLKRQQVRSQEEQSRNAEMLRQALDPGSGHAPASAPLPSPPQVAFDPALLEDPAIPASLEGAQVSGLRQHLRRFSGQVSPRNAIARLEDPTWRDAWDAALATTAGARVLLLGGELGVFALRALQHGAAHARCVEAFPLDARITAGMVQKDFMARWHHQHGTAIQGWSDAQRRESFERFASCVEVVAAHDEPADDAAWDCLVLPQVDHTLLGTGIVRAARRHAGGGSPAARMLPARATVFAMAIQWQYPGTDFRLEPMNDLRWSMYPQALDLDPAFWTPLTRPVQVGEIDFAQFAETTWEVSLAVTDRGRVDAIVFWFDLDLGGNARISNAPGSELRCIRPAVQYTDAIQVQPGQALEVCVRVTESRLHFQTRPPAAAMRSRPLPSWYVPMLGDRCRNEAYRSALTRALATSPADAVLDIGAGCGLLSMMAAQAGAGSVVGCEADPVILKAAADVVALNRMEDRIALVGTDCRRMKVPEDLPQRADLAVFELFDCSLIGEGILHFLAHAREHLLAPNARFLPASATIRACVIEYRLDRIWDIDTNLLNPYRTSTAFCNVDASKLTYRVLTEPVDVFAFDFARAGPAPEETTLRLPAIAPGTAGAVLFWFDLRLDDDCCISNDPAGGGGLHWKQGLQVLPEVRTDAGDCLPLTARHDGSSLVFQWQQDSIPEASRSRIPRWDPRWIAASRELEHQNQGLLQHCAQNPEEYRRVLEIARRFAVDPAAHDLDPITAQRFAAMLS